jgi:hypothetical protein
MLPVQIAARNVLAGAFSPTKTPNNADQAVRIARQKGIALFKRRAESYGRRKLKQVAPRTDGGISTLLFENVNSKMGRSFRRAALVSAIHSRSEWMALPTRIELVFQP